MNQNDPDRSYAELTREIGSNTKGIFESELDLIKSELREIAPRTARHSAEIAGFSLIAALSVFPFLSFLVIGLGEIFGGRYWLSSLIVAVFCAAIGIPLALRSWKRLKNEDFNFNRSRQGLSRSVQAIHQTIDSVVHSVEGKQNEHSPSYRH